MKLLASYVSRYSVPQTYIGAGTPSKDAYVGFDTGSDITWLFSKDCNTCGITSDYLCSSSTTCVSTATTQTLHYNGTDITGTTAQDLIQFGSIISGEFSYINIESKSPSFVTYINGMIGLGLQGFSDSKHFIKELISSNMISSAIVGVSMRPKGTAIIFGDYDHKIVKKRSNLRWFNMSENEDWHLDLTDFQINGMSFGPVKMKIVTGQTQMTVPADVYNSILSSVTQKAFCLRNICTVAYKVYKRLKPIYMYFDAKHKIKLLYTNYVHMLSYYYDQGYMAKYQLDIEKGDSWSIGTNIIQNFYMVFDYENKSVGIKSVMPSVASRLLSVYIVVPIMFFGFGLPALIIKIRR